MAKTLNDHLCAVFGKNCPNLMFNTITKLHAYTHSFYFMFIICINKEFV